MPSDNTPQKNGRIYLQKEGSIARVWIDHPGKLNALTVKMWGELRTSMQTIAADQSLRVAVIQGVGEAFAAGADISEFPSVRFTRDQVRHFHEEVIAPALTSIVHCPIPVVAAIHGPCVGGGLEIASVCDLRIASDVSRFGIPINRLGFPLAPAETLGLIALVGRAVALEILLEGRILDAQEALTKGLINRCVPSARWADEVGACVGRINEGSPHAARRNKWLIHTLSRLNQKELLSPEQVEACWDFVDTQDYRQAISAFLSKAKPRFENH